jgi:hypothetical protein
VKGRSKLLLLLLLSLLGGVLSSVWAPVSDPAALVDVLLPLLFCCAAEMFLFCDVKR